MEEVKTVIALSAERAKTSTVRVSIIQCVFKTFKRNPYTFVSELKWSSSNASLFRKMIKLPCSFTYL